MNFFMVFNGRKVKQLMLILVVSFFTALFFYSQSAANVSVFSTKEGPKAVYKGEKGIALTFDIGWGDEKAAPIIEALDKEGVKSATFFLSGSWAERHPDIVNKIVKQGYEIGSLGYAYEDYTELDSNKIKTDIIKAQEVFNKLNIKKVKLLRSPTGHFDEKTLKVAENLGLTVVHWSVNSDDWKNPGVEKIVKKTVRAKNGDIILLHASDSARQTAQAIPTLVKELSKKSNFISVSDMIANGKVKTTLIQ
ncbi:polysaccharide deacetylase family sporulation protein PdaB [Bacillus sp. FJAT-49736]|uniref:polysaccharide deacetylase family sporulation protein PdaB n=1 Tax=Bacillus sp. FJAT-49736 TaxID=2833582 RepID=UPI001BCA0F9F|nr:polysaccharide deacetylase family sporulation protein PdaB [Bacillus sp. FJAT-49736]MBS4175660.1 polysaccharide deacetylase family sporulation protein PdaB [Bacillus sp. FJAT-49736]